MQNAFQSRPTGIASPEEFVCLPPAMTGDHIVHMVRAEHHPLYVLMAPAPHRADRDQSHVLIAPVPHCAGFTFDPTTALRIPSVTEGAKQDVTAPDCDDCDVEYTCEAHRGIYQCDDGVPGCNCSQPEVSIGGAIPIGGADATDDETTTDIEAGACAGYCDTSTCGSECKCSTRFKRQRPIVRAACDLLPVGTFRRPPLFKCGDEVQFAAPDRRIRLRTFGTITSVVY